MTERPTCWCSGARGFPRVSLRPCRFRSFPAALAGGSGRLGHCPWDLRRRVIRQSIGLVRSVIERRGTPDLVVRHGSPFLPSRSCAVMAGGGTAPRLARVSGRDGRILWDVALGEDTEDPNADHRSASGFGDLDLDGVLDVVVALPGSPDHELRAFSLRDGKLLWSHSLDSKPGFTNGIQLAVSDVDGDQRPEVIVALQPGPVVREALVLKAIDGRDGTTRWTWTSGVPEAPNGSVFGWLCVADCSGKTGPAVYLRLVDPKGLHRVIAFDEHGRERASRELPKDAAMELGRRTSTAMEATSW